MPVTNKVRVNSDSNYTGRATGDSTSLWVADDVLKFTAQDQTVVELSALPTNIDTEDFTLADHSDDTKKIQFSAASVSTGTTRTITAPDADITLVGVAATQTLTNKTLTSPVLTTPSKTDLTEVVTATNVLLASESGKICFLNSATEFVSTLPAVAAGLNFTFVVTAAPSGASYTVVGASGTPIKGHVISSEDAGGSGDSETSGALTLTFVDGKAVAGDKAVFVCDGTNWFVTATCKTHDAVTLS